MVGERGYGTAQDACAEADLLTCAAYPQSSLALCPGSNSTIVYRLAYCT